MGWWHWLLHVTGSDNVSGTWYGFWSGFGGDLGIVGALLTVPLTTWKRHNCAVRRCWRIGRHAFLDPDDKVLRNLCHVHHPDVTKRQITREQLHLYLGKRPGRG